MTVRVNAIHILRIPCISDRLELLVKSFYRYISIENILLFIYNR